MLLPPAVPDPDGCSRNPGTTDHPAGNRPIQGDQKAAAKDTVSRLAQVLDQLDRVGLVSGLVRPVPDHAGETQRQSGRITG